MSSATTRKFRILSSIAKFGSPVLLPCRACYRQSLLDPEVPVSCVMSLQHSAKCSKCVSLNRPCIAVSWEVLERSQNDLRNQIDRAEGEAKELRARRKEVERKEDIAYAKVERLRTTLKLAEARADEKVRCLDRELDAELQERINRDDLSDGEREDLEYGRQMEESLRALQQMSPEEINSSLGVPLTSSSS